jgi:hypothetical protein
MVIRKRSITEYEKPFRIGKATGLDFHKGDHGTPYIYITLKKNTYQLFR